LKIGKPKENKLALKLTTFFWVIVPYSFANALKPMNWVKPVVKLLHVQRFCGNVFYAAGLIAYIFYGRALQAILEANMENGYLLDGIGVPSIPHDNYPRNNCIASTVSFLKEFLVEKSGNSVHLVGNHLVLLTGLKMALAAMENWEGYSPDKRRSILESIKGLIAKSRVI